MKLIQKLAKFLGRDTLEMKDGKLSLAEAEEKKLREFLGDKYEAVITATEKEESEGEAAAQLQAAAAALAEGGEDTPPETQGQTQTIDVAASIRKLQEQIETLSASQEDSKGTTVDPPVKIIPINAGLGFSTKTHLFGIEHDFFSLAKPWNKMAATKESIGNDWDEHKENFEAEFKLYGRSLAKRIHTLQDNNQLGSIKMEDIDFSGFTGTGWGEDYIVRRQDALIAYLRDLPSVSNIFPVRYGVQDKETMTNSFLEDFSQAYQPGKVFKGKHTVEPELADVKDVMFKHQFTNLKNLESEYIGYLNREGSDPMKWSFIEWLMSQTLRKLHNEQEERRIRGHRIEPVEGKAGHHMFGSNGVIRKLYQYVEDFKIAPFTTINKYTPTTILDVIDSFVEMVNLAIPSLRGYRLYMNEKHVPWYLSAYRERYGTHADFKGEMLDIKNYNIDGIVPVPNMGNSYLLWITIPGNIELLELKAGEMAAIYFQRDLENLIAASWWKEGSTAYMSGKKYPSLEELLKSKRKFQYIFMNDPFVQLEAGATTADGSLDNRFKTQDNGAETTFTDITNKEEGIVYRLECGGTDNATSVAKSDKFSGITAAWEPTAEGDFLEVYWDASLDEGNGKFVEVRRKVS